MPQIVSSEEVFRQLVEDSDDDWLFGLVAFAIVEEQRIEWMKHFEENNGQVPSDAEVRHWYTQQPDGVLLRAKGTAENALERYSDAVLQAELETERREVADGVIVSEIRLARKFWPQFGISMAGGLVSAILFAALLTILVMVVLADKSPVDLGKALIGHQTEEIVDGKANTTSRSDE